MDHYFKLIMSIILGIIIGNFISEKCLNTINIIQV